MSKNAPRWVLGEADNGDPGDPYKRLMFSVLLDAICKSIMTNDPESDKVITSAAAMAGMIEAREWLMDPTDGELSRNFYLSGLSISMDALIEALRHLWRRQAPTMRATIRNHMKPVRGGKKRRIQPSKTNNLAHRAMDVLKQSNEWVGV